MEGFDIEVYMQKIKQELLNTFGDELVYLGLQGSFRRGEARESSDIDVMVILEEFTVERMAEYREILKDRGGLLYTPRRSRYTSQRPKASDRSA